jgi:hypothetical protein
VQTGSSASEALYLRVHLPESYMYNALWKLARCFVHVLARCLVHGTASERMMSTTRTVSFRPSTKVHMYLVMIRGNFRNMARYEAHHPAVVHRSAARVRNDHAALGVPRHTGEGHTPAMY